nr:Flp family type IVb pilin [uncultured Desulfobacter sp.]
MTNFFKTFWEDESGATAIEYGLIVGIMAAVIITVLGAFGDKLAELFSAITEQLDSVTETIKNQE